MLQLVIGNKNYSSWSLRPWLLLRHFAVPFHEVRLPLDTPEFQQRIPDYSPTGRVPVLHDGARVVWDSLAICEYVNETFLGGRGWPEDPALRYLARCAAAEMHSGFAAMRAQLPMNCRRTPNAYRWKADADADIRRVLTLWRDLRRRSGGPFLLGDFGIVDAMFAPVAIRFRGYGVVLDDNARHYTEALFALPSMREWQAAAEAETERLAHDAL
jgi:glutathione S-transferase